MSFENFLLIDASSPLSVFAGTLGAGGRAWNRFAEEKSAALEGVFSAVESAGGNASAAGFLFCEGPGSILGIRIAAAAIRAWLALDRANGAATRPVFAFRSLALAATLISRAFPREKNFAVVAESRMNCWNVFGVREGVPAEDFREMKTAELTDALPPRVFLLPARRALPTALADAEPCSVAELLKNDPAVFAETPALLRDCGAEPDAVNASAVDSYAKWTPQRHRAPRNSEISRSR